MPLVPTGARAPAFLGSTIGHTTRDRASRGNKWTQMRWLSQKQIPTEGVRSHRVRQTMTRVASLLGMPPRGPIVSDALGRIYRLYASLDSRSESVPPGDIMAWALWGACSDAVAPIPLLEIVKAVRSHHVATIHAVTGRRVVRLAARLADLGLAPRVRHSRTPADYVPRTVSLVAAEWRKQGHTVSESTEVAVARAAQDLLAQIPAPAWSSRRPQTFAATLVWATARLMDLEWSRRLVAAACDLSDDSMQVQFAQVVSPVFHRSKLFIRKGTERATAAWRKQGHTVSESAVGDVVQATLNLLAQIPSVPKSRKPQILVAAAVYETALTLPVPMSQPVVAAAFGVSPSALNICLNKHVRPALADPRA